MQPQLSLIAAIEWIVGALLGSVAMSASMLAIAALGILSFLGRAPFRRAMLVVLGCFILFSAISIGTGMARGVEPSDNSVYAAGGIAPSYVPIMPSPAPYDPYAGAAVPAAPEKTTIR